MKASTVSIESTPADREALEEPDWEAAQHLRAAEHRNALGEHELADRHWEAARRLAFAESDYYDRQYRLWCVAHRGRDHRTIAPRRGTRARGAGRPGGIRRTSSSSRTSSADPGDDDPDGHPDHLHKPGSGVVA